MALVKCRECGKEMSDKAAACPQCGAPGQGALTVVPPKSKNYGCGTLILLGFIGFVLFSIFSPTRTTTSTQRAAPANASGATGGTPAAAKPAVPGAQWNYSVSADEMGKGATKNALLESSNSFRLGFPYTGEQRASLQIRNHPRHGKDAIFFVDKGQLHCAYRACNWNIRFDEAPAAAFTLAEPESRESEMMFIQNFDRFYGAMRKAKRVRIEAQFFQQPPVVMDFDVSGFDPKRIGL